MIARLRKSNCSMDRGVSASNKISLFSGSRQCPTGGCPEGLVAPAERSGARRPLSLREGPSVPSGLPPCRRPAQGRWEGPAEGEAPNSR